MATSGVFTHTTTRNDIIKDAFRKLGIRGMGGAMPAEDMEYAGRTLNQMISFWQTKGIGIWALSEVTVFLAEETISYDLGPSGDHAALTAYTTELGDDAEETDTELTVDSISNISDGDHIGIVMDDGTLEWTTVSGDPSGATVPITDALSGDASDGNTVFVYTTLLPARPIEVLSLRLRNTDATDIPMERMSRSEYDAMATKTTVGTPVKGYYDPQLTNGKLYLWMSPSDVSNRVVLTARLPFEVFTTYGIEPDIPQEYELALVYGLAKELAATYPDKANPASIQIVLSEAERTFNTLVNADADNKRIQFVPNMRGAK